MITVVAALIEKENKFLIAKRSTGDPNVLGKWEFPGGKVEPFEDENTAIEREILEEFELEIKANRFITNKTYKYPNKTIDLRLYSCDYISGEFKLHSHSEYKFVDLKEILNYDLAPADIPLVEHIMSNLTSKNFYYGPIDATHWNIFDIVDNRGYQETFLATKDMKKGDIIFLYIGSNTNYESGIYGYAEITSEPYIYVGNSKDKCHQRLSVDTKVIQFRKNKPYLHHDECKKYISSFRKVCNIPKGNEIYKIIDDALKIDNLTMGKIYSNDEIVSIFKCSNMGNMRRSHETNSLVLIAKHNNPLYDDYWTKDGIFNYTGMGETGDQSINFSQNKALSNSKQENIGVYLFESYKDNEYYYVGEVELCDSIFETQELDSNGNMRKVIKFPLKKIDLNANIYFDLQSIEASEKEKIKAVKKHSLKEIKERAQKSESITAPITEVKTIYRERNQYIAEYTKERAKGKCDLCGMEAPFKDKHERPYLESHHVITLAEGGPDSIYNTVAICPNCHRRMHVLHNKEDIKQLQLTILKYLTLDDDEENIKKLKEIILKEN